MLVFLIGFMGSGKTTAGKMAAEMLGFSFIDLDHFIEEKYKKTINEIFSLEGENHFRLLEQEAIQELPKDRNLLIATGGGFPSHENNMEWLNENGETIYLKAHRGTLFSRLLHVKKNRPLIRDLSDVGLMEFIMNVLPGREIYYEKAKHRVETMNEKPMVLSTKIADLISKNIKK